MSRYASGKIVKLTAKLNPADVILYADIDVGVTTGRFYYVSDLQEEWIDFTGVAASGTSFAYSGLTRGLSQTADPATVGTGKTWIAGSGGTLVAMHDQLADKQKDNTFDGTQTFTDLDFTGTTTGGLKVKSLTTTQRDAISPTNGLIIYNLTDSVLNQYVGLGWQNFAVGPNTIYSGNNQTVKTAGEDLTALNTVGLSDICKGGEYLLGSGILDSIRSVLLTTDTVLFAFRDTDDSNYLKAVVGTFVGNVITYGTVVSLEAVGIDEKSISITKLSSSKTFISYKETSGNVKCLILLISGTVINPGAVVDTTVASGTGNTASCKLDTDKVLLNIGVGTDNNTWVGTITGTSIVLGTKVVTAAGGSVSNCYLTQITTDKAILSYNNAGTDTFVSVVSVALTVPTLNTAVEILTSRNSSSATSTLIDTDKVLISAISQNTLATNSIITISGTTPTEGTETIVTGATISDGYIVSVTISTTQAFMVYGVNSVIINISGTTITYGIVGQVPNASSTPWATLLDSTRIAYANGLASDGTENASVLNLGDGIYKGFGNFIGFVLDTASSGADFLLVTNGILDGFTGLTFNTIYYTSSTAPGEITTTSTSGILVGLAISETEILINTGDF